jgi:hypothetical protein
MYFIESTNNEKQNANGGGGGVCTNYRVGSHDLTILQILLSSSVVLLSVDCTN